MYCITQQHSDPAHLRTESVVWQFGDIFSICFVIILLVSEISGHKIASCKSIYLLQLTKDPTIHDWGKTHMITKPHARFNFEIISSCVSVIILHVSDIFWAAACVSLTWNAKQCYILANFSKIRFFSVKYLQKCTDNFNNIFSCYEIHSRLKIKHFVQITLAITTPEIKSKFYRPLEKMSGEFWKYFFLVRFYHMNFPRTFGFDCSFFQDMIIK